MFQQYLVFILNIAILYYNDLFIDVPFQRQHYIHHRDHHHVFLDHLVFFIS